MPSNSKQTTTALVIYYEIESIKKFTRRKLLNTIDLKLAKQNQHE